MNHFQFLSPGWLLLLPLAWVIVFWLWRNAGRHSMWVRICDPHLLRRMRGSAAGSGNNRLRYWILAALFSLGIVAAAGPSWSLQTQAQAHAISARVLVLELSRAMLVEDVRPNRFTEAIRVARDLLDAEYNGETGLVVYAGAAFVVSPLSRDAGTLHAFLDALDPSTMPLDGQRIDLALNLARDLLAASPSDTGQILVIGTGASPSDNALQSAINLAEQGLIVSVLAIGTDEGGPLKDPAGGLIRDAQGKFQISRPDFSVLQSMAEVSNGQFIKTAESAMQTGMFIRDAGLIESTLDLALDAEDDLEPANDGYWIVWFMLPLALLLFRRNQLWALLILGVLPLDHPLQAADLHNFWKHPEHLAYDAFIAGNYADSLSLARDPVLRGSALYRQGRYEQALESFAQSDSATSHYNRGNAMVQLQRFTEAVLAYDRALKLDPAHAKARHNRRVLEYYLEQQSAKEAEGGGDQSDDPSEDDSPSENTQARVGITGEQLANPGEDPDSGSGLGVSLEPGSLDFSENYDGSEQQLERFTLTEGSSDPKQDAMIETWIKTLPQSSSELYRRKFLRDYQRQTRQER